MQLSFSPTSGNIRGIIIEERLINAILYLAREWVTKQTVQSFAVLFAILRLRSARCHMPVGPSESTDFKLKVLLKYIASDEEWHLNWDTTSGQSHTGSCPVLALDF